MAENKKSFKIPDNSIYPKATDVTKDSFPIEGGVAIRGTDSTEFGVGNSIIATTYKGGLHSQSIIDANSTRPRISTRASQKLPDEPLWRGDYENYPDGADVNIQTSVSQTIGSYNYSNIPPNRWTSISGDDWFNGDDWVEFDYLMQDGGLICYLVTPNGVGGQGMVLGNAFAAPGLGYKVTVEFEQLGYSSILGVGIHQLNSQGTGNKRRAQILCSYDNYGNRPRLMSDFVYNSSAGPNNYEFNYGEGIQTYRYPPASVTFSPTNPIGAGKIEYSYAWPDQGAPANHIKVGWRYQLDVLGPEWQVGEMSNWPATPIYQEYTAAALGASSIEQWFINYFTSSPPQRNFVTGTTLYTRPYLNLQCIGSIGNPNSWTIIKRIKISYAGDGSPEGSVALGNLSPEDFWTIGNEPIITTHLGTGWGPEIFVGEERWVQAPVNNFTAESNVRYMINTEVSAADVALPSAPELGDFVEILDLKNTFAINNCNLSFSGQPFNGDTNNPSLILEYAGTHVKLVYTDSITGWKIVKD